MVISILALICQLISGYSDCLAFQRLQLLNPNQNMTKITNLSFGSNFQDKVIFLLYQPLDFREKIAESNPVRSIP
jgi:hypothetical protein